MKKYIAFAVFALGLGLFGVTLTAKVNKRLAKVELVAKEAEAKQGEQNHKAPPTIEIPQPGPATQPLVLTGSLRPEAEVDLGFKLPGRVLEVAVQRGDVVKAGQLLARIDASDLEAQAAQADAGIKAASLQKALAEDAAKRSKDLAEVGVASDQQVVMTGGQANLGAAQVAQATAARKYIDVVKRETRLYAPIDGVVVRAPTAAGFFAGPGTPLFRIERLSTLRFQGHLSDKDAARVSKGQAIAVQSDAGFGAEGKLELVIPSVDPMTRRVPVEGLIPNADGKLFAGSMVEATLEVPAPQTWMVSSAALLTGSEPAVLVVGADNKLERRAVEVLRSAGGKLYVTKGLAASDRVVVGGGTNWRAGDSLAGVDLTAAKPGAAAPSGATEPAKSEPAKPEAAKPEAAKSAAPTAAAPAAAK